MTRERTVQLPQAGVPVGTLRVEVLKGPCAPKTFQAQSDVVTIGSAPGNDLVLEDDTISRYHLELRAAGARISVQDLGSTNGTAYGAAQLERATVTPGATLTLGKTELRVDHGAPVEAEAFDDDHLDGLYGRTPVMRRLMAQIARTAQTDASMLLLGETGSGKEVIAHAIHRSSRRKKGPFEAVDCGSLMPTLIASELFGHEKGAFTGADRQHVGAFERANGGTLFLDEIGELPSSLQPALLGALERRSFRRVGGQKPISVDVRLIAATHRDLRSEVNAGSFRQDLYFRLAVVLLEIPPLRARADDIPVLAERFLRVAGYEGELDRVLPPAAIEMMKRHHWPGNVRELRNFVEATLALGEAPRIGGAAPSPEAVEPGPSGFGELLERRYGEAKDALLERFEREYLTALMARAEGNVSRASREADMNRSHLLELLKRHGLR